jgi:hypothetical protein
MPIVVKDHESLHDAVGRAVLAGGGAAVLGMFLPAPLALAALVLSVGLAVVPPVSWASAAWAVLCACAAGGAHAIGGAVGGVGAALAVGASIARGLDGAGRLTAGVLGTAGMLAAALVGQAAGASGAVGLLPSGLTALAVGAASGLVIAVSSIGRHFARALPSVDGELVALARGGGELGELLGRAAVAYRDALAALGNDAPAARAAARELVDQLTRFGSHWQLIDAESRRTDRDEVAGRLRALEARLELAGDSLTRGELGRAREALVAQLGYLDEIERGRERAVARLTHQVAALERLRLAALRQRSADAGRLGSDLQPMVDELSQAGRDLELSADALDEGDALLRLPG